MAVYTTITQDDLHTLMRTYGFATLPTAHPIAEGVENTNYLLHYRDAQGQETRVILTLFEARVRTEDIPFFLHLKEHLNGNHIPCPLPERTLNGELTTTLQGKNAAVVSFLNGASVSFPSSDHCRQAGEMLARLHEAAAGFPLSRANGMSYAGWRDLREKIVARRYRVQPPDLLAGIDAALEFAQRNWPDDLPSGIIHADFFPNNVFFDAEGRLSGVIDFYFACTDLLAYDLAIVVNAWCFDARGHVNEELFKAVLKGYETIRPLTGSEKTALPALLRVAALRFLLTRLHDQLYPDADALVTPHDPLHYARIMEYHTRHALLP